MKKNRALIAVIAVVGIALLVWLWRGRSEGDAHSDSTVPTAAVTEVKRRDLGDTLTVSGAFKPFQDIDVHAKVAGYIKVIHVDVGDHVKEGQPLAVLEIPELAAQLAGTDAEVRAAQEQIRRSQGDLDRAQSTHAAAHSAYHRLKQAADTQPGLVAQQELDDWQAKD